MAKINTLKSLVYIDGIDRTREIDKIFVYSNITKIKFQYNPKMYSYKNSHIVIKKNYLEDKKTKEIMTYFSKEAEYSPIKIGDNDVSLLKKYFSEIPNITKDIVLSYFLSPRPLKQYAFDTNMLIYPFGLNTSQKKAIENSFLSPISIVQGPPGTGKTQTILNIIANTFLQKKSIAVVSNNNSAIENIEEKLKKQDLDFLIARLGAKKNKEIFIENQSDIPNLSSFKSSVNVHKLSKKIAKNAQIIDEILVSQNNLAKLKQQLEDLETEYRYFKETYICDNAQDIETKFKRINSDKIFKIWAYCLNSPHNEFKLRNYLYFLRNAGIRYFFLENKNIFQQIQPLQNLYYSLKIKEIKKGIQKQEKFLNGCNLKSRMDVLTKTSMIMLKSNIFKQMSNHKRKRYTLRDVSHLSEKFIEDYPIVLSTLFSLKNLCNGNFIFDYLVVDEASQADLLTSTLAMSCARNIIVVGDIKQLPNVITREVEQNSEVLLRNFKIPEAYHFHKNSLLSSILSLYPDAPNTMLREHYRCHPKIIGFCNHKFYDDNLIILPENDKAKDTLKAIQTPPGNHARGHVNQRQIDIIKQEVLPYIGNDKNLSIGVISPFRAQVEALRNNLGEDIEIDTIHKFQGREKDIIVFSTVDNKISDFIDNPNLINVAVSRAVKKFWIVYSNEDSNINSNLMDLINYIKYNNFEVKLSHVHSIFDLLYKRYTLERVAFLKKHRKVSQYASENIAYDCIVKCLNQIQNTTLNVVAHIPLKSLIKIDDKYNEEEIAFINHSSHVDFLLYNKMNKEPFLAIEVDGYAYHHRTEEQEKRNNLKNSILEKAHLPLLRLSTTGSNESDLIISKINSIYNNAIQEDDNGL